MTYIKAYFGTVGLLMGTLGALFILLEALRLDPAALYITYLSLVVGLAGPIRLAIDAMNGNKPRAQ